MYPEMQNSACIYLVLGTSTAIHITKKNKELARQLKNDLIHVNAELICK